MASSKLRHADGQPGFSRRPLRRLVPAGSVYWFEIVHKGDRPLSSIWMQSTCRTEFARDGFGLALPGVTRAQDASVEEQIVILYAGSSGALDTVPLNRVSDFEKKYLAFMRSTHADVLNSLRTEKKWTDVLQKKCDEVCAKFRQEFLA